MWSFIARFRIKTDALRFLTQHNLGQSLITLGDGGPKMRCLRSLGHVVSDRISPDRWVHKIVSKPQA